MRLSGLLAVFALAAGAAWGQVPTAPTGGSWNSGGTSSTGTDLQVTAVTSRQMDDGYRTAPGPYKTGADDIIITDPVRSREITIKVRYPKEAPGKLPVIIFSHGEGDTGEGFAELTDHWASYGYVVLLPTHDETFNIRGQSGEKKPPTEMELLQHTRPGERLADIVYILDSFSLIEGKVPALNSNEGTEKLDRAHIGVAGHSAGAMAAEMLIGTKTRMRPMEGPRDLSDVRIKAAVLISADGHANPLFSKDSWSGVNKPVFVVGGSEDASEFLHETSAARREAFELAKPGNKYLLFIQGVTHWSYEGEEMADRMKETPTASVSMTTQVIAAGTLAFWDACLGSDDKARAAATAYLASDKLEAFSGLKAELKRK